MFNPVRDLPMSKATRKSNPPKPKPKYRDRGPHGLSVPEAGAMIGLGRNASYDAAKEGRIPVLENWRAEDRAARAVAQADRRR